MNKRLYPLALALSLILAALMLMPMLTGFALGEDIDAAQYEEDSAPSLSDEEVSTYLREYIKNYEAAASATNRAALLGELIADENELVRRGEASAVLDGYKSELKNIEGELERAELGMRKYKILLGDVYPDAIDIEAAEASLMLLVPEDIDEAAAADAAVSAALEAAVSSAEESARADFESEALVKQLEAIKNAVTQTSAQSSESETVTESEAVTVSAPEPEPETTQVAADTEGHVEDTLCTCHYCLSLTTEETTTEPALRPRTTRETTTAPQSEVEISSDDTLESVDDTDTSETTEITSEAAVTEEVAVTVSTETTAEPAEVPATEESTAEEFIFDASAVTVDEKTIRGGVSIAVIDINLCYSSLKKASDEYEAQCALVASLEGDYRKNLCDKATLYAAMREKYRMRGELFASLCELDSLCRSLDSVCGNIFSADVNAEP